MSAVALSDEYHAYLRSPEWAKLRRAALARAEGRCQVCNTSRRLDVHHRTYERFGHERLADLTVLCRACHDLFHEAKRRRRRRQIRSEQQAARDLPVSPPTLAELPIPSPPPSVDEIREQRRVEVVQAREEALVRRIEPAQRPPATPFVSATHAEILRALEHNGSLTSAQIGRLVDLRGDRVGQELSRLRKRRLVIKHKRGGKSVWKAVPICVRQVAE